MADNKKIQSDISGFFDRLRGQDKIRKSDSLIVLDTPQSDRERQTKQKISSIVQFVKNKTWSRRHVEFFEEYRRMSSTFPIIKAGLDIYAEETCLTGDTIIPLLTNEKKSLKELYDLSVNNFYTYGFNPQTLKMEPTLCEKVIYKGKKQIGKLLLDDGTVIECTLDHKFLLKNGIWVEAKDLTPGDSLRSLYLKNNRVGYLTVTTGEFVKTTAKYKWEVVHSIVGNTVLKEQKNNLPSNLFEGSLNNTPVIHHKSFDKLNNDPKELEWMLWKDHKDLHNSLNSSRWNNLEFATKMRAKFSQHAKSLWQNEEWGSWKKKHHSQVIRENNKKLTVEQRKVKYGRPGEKNGMYGSSRTGCTNPNANLNYNHVENIVFDDYVETLLNGLTIKQRLKHFNISEATNCHLFKQAKEKYNFTSPIDFIVLGTLQKLKGSIKSFKELYKETGRPFESRKILDSLNKMGYSSIEELEQSIFSNHKVISFEITNEEKDVYDIFNAGKYHNFAIQCNEGMLITHNCARDSNSNIFNIKSNNKKVKDLLEELFFKTLALNSKGSKIVRQMCQFGNSYGWLTTRPKDGVTDIVFLPPEAIIRENMYDPSNLENYRFVWYGSGGGAMFEPYEIVHWKNSEDIESEPYGTSILRPIVDTWRRVILIREALVIYRITRAPSKLLFKIGTDGMTGEEAFRFAQEMKKEVQKKPLVNPQTGEIDFKYNPMPVHKDTPIPLLDGRVLTIEELAKEYESCQSINYVYSTQDNTHQIVPGKVKWCGKNYTANKLIRVWLDNESYIDSAPEHPFILRDGSKKNAEDLKSGDSLMPFYQQYKKIDKKSNEYHQTYNPAIEKYEFTHRLIAKEVVKEDINLNTVHHIDFNRYNNSPLNLKWMGFHEHREYHRSLNKERKSFLVMLPYVQSKENRERVSKMFSEINKSRKNNVKIRKEWVDLLSKKININIWERIISKIEEGNLKTSKDIVDFINNDLVIVNTLKHINKCREPKVTITVLNKELKKIGYKSLTFFLDNVKNKKTEPLMKLFFSLNEKIRLEEINSVEEVFSFIEKKIDKEKFSLTLKLRGFSNVESYFIASRHKGKLRQIQFSDKVWLKINDLIRSGKIKNYSTAEKELSIPENLSLITQSNNRVPLSKIDARTIKVKILNKGYSSIKEYIAKVKEEESVSIYKNHKVDRIEILENVSEDVYCMTVVGLNDEDDRHNFAILGLNKDKSINNSGVFVKNSIEESIFMPTYEGSPTDVSVLEGASNLDAVEDYKIIKDDLFAGLKIPKSWLSFEEDLSNKSALGEEDIRFAKTIQKIQADFVEGLLHIGLVHLFMKGCSQEEMQSFTIEMNNPSIASEKKKLELIEARLNIAKSAWDYNNPGLNLMSYVDVLKSILKFTDKEVEQIIKAQFNEKKIAWRLEQLRTNGMYEEPEIEKKLAELKGLTGSGDGKIASGLDSLQFEGGTLTEMLKQKIDDEIREILSPVSATPSAKQVRTLTEGALAKNLRKAKKDFGL